MDPEEWGPHFWVTIHAAAVAYPERPTIEDKKRYFKFYKTLGWVLPCEACAVKFRGLFAQNKPSASDMASRAALFEWTVKMHNFVNMTLGKPEFHIQRAKKMYGFSVSE